MAITYPKEASAPETVDDLTRIKGIGHAVEARLNRAGIYTFAQLSVASPKQISKFLPDMIGMTPENIKEQDWIGQATRLAPETQEDDAAAIRANLGNRQHYETFSIKLLEDTNNQVRRTNIVHVQKGMEQNWAGWDEEKLLSFITENARLNVSSSEKDTARNTGSFPPHTQAPTEEVRRTETRVHPHHNRILAINSATIFQAGNKGASYIIPIDLDWSIRLEWTLSGPEPLFGNWLVKIYLESMGPGPEYVLPDETGVRVDLISGVPQAPHVFSYATELKFNAGEISPGIYWLVASIAWEKHLGKLGSPMQISDKLMLQFYSRK